MTAILSIVLLLKFNLPANILVVNDTVYILEMKEIGLPDGSLWKISLKDFLKGKKIYKKITKGMIDPESFVFLNKKFYIVDIDRIWEVYLSGKKNLFVRQGDFVIKPNYLTGITTDEKYFYVTDQKDNKIYKIDISTKKIEELTNKIPAPGPIFFYKGKLYVLTKTFPSKLFVIEKGKIDAIKILKNINIANGIFIEGDFLYASGFRNGKIIKLNLKTLKEEVIIETESYLGGIFKYKNFLFYTDLTKGEIRYLELK